MAYNNPNVRIHQSDGSAWKLLYKDMAESGVSKQHVFYRLKKKHTNPAPVQPKIEMVTPAAQTTEAAKANLQNERSIMDPQNYNSAGRPVGRAPAKKRGKIRALPEPVDDDIFAWNVFI